MLRWPLPRITPKSGGFSALLGFFRRFIKNYTRIARPLNNLLEGEASKWKAQPVDFTPEAVEAFDLLKTKCVTVPVIAFADFEKLFLLETDASSCGPGSGIIPETRMTISTTRSPTLAGS